MSDDPQAGFAFDRPVQPDQQDGYQLWQRQRSQAKATLGATLGLPLGRNVEIRLYDGVVLNGVLELKEEMLFIEKAALGHRELRIGRATFLQSEIASCVLLS